MSRVVAGIAATALWLVGGADAAVPAPAVPMPNPSETAAVARLLEQAGSDDIALRLSAIQALEVVDATGFAPHFVAALEDPSAIVRQLACRKLKGAAGAVDAVPPLIRRLARDPAAPVRRSCAAALGNLGDVRALQPLVQAARGDPEVDVRRFAVVALGSLGEGDAAVPLGRLLVGPTAEQSTDVREAAVRALARLQDARAVAPLIATFQDQPRPAVAEALAAIGSPEAWAFLRAAFVDPRTGEGRLSIARLLLENGADDALLLTRVVHGSDAGTRALIYRAAREAEVADGRRQPFVDLARTVGVQDVCPSVRKAARELIEWVD
jgi:HEAT repeat protein